MSSDLMSLINLSPYPANFMKSCNFAGSFQFSPRPKDTPALTIPMVTLLELHLCSLGILENPLAKNYYGTACVFEY